MECEDGIQILGGEMLIANKYEIPDSCPENCRFKGVGATSQGDICTRCPIFNCQITEAPEEYGGPFRLLEPNDYREDWAEQWYRFFQGEIQMPLLYFQKR